MENQENPNYEQPNQYGEYFGRPSKKIDWDVFDKLCALQHTLIELAYYFNCSVDTIERNVKDAFGVTFAEYFAIKRQKGLMSLRRKQFQLAEEGSIPMLIWLDKKYLGGESEHFKKDESDKPNDNSDDDTYLNFGDYITKM